MQFPFFCLIKFKLINVIHDKVFRQKRIWESQLQTNKWRKKCTHTHAHTHARTRLHTHTAVITASYSKLTCTHDRWWFQQMLVLHWEVLWWVVLNKWQIQWQICIWQDIQRLTNSIQFCVVGFQDLNSNKLIHINCEHPRKNVISLPTS